jgi:cytochrome c556
LEELMRATVMVLLAGTVLAEALTAQTPPAQTPSRQELESDAVRTMRRIGSMSELMVHLIYPTSDAVFYFETRTPTTDAEWGELEAKTLMFGEAANLLLMPDRIREPEAQWISDAVLLLEVGRAALRATRNRDVPALAGLNDQLYQSCVSCHSHFRQGYGRRPGG